MVRKGVLDLVLLQSLVVSWFPQGSQTRSDPQMMLSNWSRPRTKIVCTLGPSVQSPSRIQWLVEAGMNVARLNMAHGTLEDHTTAFGHVRFIAQELKQPVGIMVDVPGPKYRTGDIPSGSLSFRKEKRSRSPAGRTGRLGRFPWCR